MDSIILMLMELCGIQQKCCSVLDRISAGKRTYGYYPDISPSDDTFGQTLSDIARQISLTVQKQNSFALLMDAARPNMKLS